MKIRTVIRRRQELSICLEEFPIDTSGIEIAPLHTY